MRKIPVTRAGRKGSEILLISSSDVVKIESVRDKEFIIHTLDDAYYYSASLDSFEEWLYEEGFRLIDQTNIVNMNYVVEYDVNKGIVYLGKPNSKKKKKASAARIHKNHIINVMEMIRIANAGKNQDFPVDNSWDELLNQIVEQNQDDRFLRSYAMIQAIYERERAEKRLEESEQRYKSLYHNNPDAVCSLDLKGRLISVNPAMERITGYTSVELMNKSIQELIVPEDVPDWEHHFALTLRGENQHYEMTFIDKERRHVEMSLINVPIVVNGEIAGVYAIAKDVTERKRAEELLIKSEKLSIVGQLAAGVAHEIRNPLTSLKGFVQLLRSKVEGYNHYFDIMLSELDRINFIVSEFLVIAKPQAVKFQPKDVRTILINTVALLNTQAIMNNVEIVTRMDDNLPPIHCDENQIKQVFINVLNNSIDAMPDGGQIEIEASCRGEEITFLFIDHGVGIPEERIPLLGEPFYTTKEKGTGLGLMVSYKIIENHRGRMSIRSELGKGTTVEIVLPIAKEAP
jgi:two-component system, sporulation sensor kinase E